jgi:hypothetical protein
MLGMISFIETLPIGNAIRVFWTPPAGASQVTILRKTADTFAGQNDPNALVVYEGSAVVSALDTNSLTNGTPYYYHEYDLINSAWVDGGASVSATPATVDQGAGPDVLSLVRDRLELALRAAVTSGAIVQALGYVPVLTAPPVFDQTKFPLVTVHLELDQPEVRGLGELVSPDIFDAGNNDWVSSEGWLSRVNLKIVGWVLNPDERIALRQSIKAALIGNLPVFDDAGMDLIEASFVDTEDFESYGAPVYQTVCDFTCLAPSVVTGTTPPINDVTVAASDALGAE